MHRCAQEKGLLPQEEVSAELLPTFKSRCAKVTGIFFCLFMGEKQRHSKENVLF